MRVKIDIPTALVEKVEEHARAVKSTPAAVMQVALELYMTEHRERETPLIDGEISSEERFERMWWTSEAMIRQGGSFVKVLGKLYRKGDLANQRRLQRSFEVYFKDYAKRGAELRQKEVE